MVFNLYRPAALRPVHDAAFGAALNRFLGEVAPSGSGVHDGAEKTRHARLEVIERADHFEASVELPGVAKEDIAIEVEGAQVSVSAQIKSVAPRSDGDRVLLSERSSARYARRFELPVEVADEATTASFENGVLKLVLPKKEAHKAKRIAIQ